VDQPDIEIKVNGRPAITAAELARRAGIKPETVYSLISRAKLKSVAQLGYVYDEEEATRFLATRPGRGAPGTPRPHKPRRSSAPTQPTTQ
jgi:hypothetical protein